MTPVLPTPEDIRQLRQFSKVLRSTPYEQGTFALVRQDARKGLCFCAEGLFAKEVLGWELASTPGGPALQPTDDYWTQDTKRLIVSDRWLPKPCRSGGPLVLAYMNDICAMTWVEMADAIDAYLADPENFQLEEA